MFFLALGLSFVGLIIISFVSPSIKPPISRLSEVNAYSIEGVVRVSGVVGDVHKFKGGSITFTVSDGNGSLNVFVPYSVGSGLDGVIRHGGVVEVSGVVEEYKGVLELVVEDKTAVVFR